MVKLIGLILIVSSLLSLMVGSMVNSRFNTTTEITGNVVSNIVTQPKVNVGFFGYAEAIAFSYSIVSLLMGIVFLFRV